MTWMDDALKTTEEFEGKAQAPATEEPGVIVKRVEVVTPKGEVLGVYHYESPPGEICVWYTNGNVSGMRRIQIPLLKVLNLTARDLTGIL